MNISLFCEDFTGLDYAYLDRDKGFVGNSLSVNVKLTGKVSEEGILYDFSLVKKVIKQVIDNICDHKLVVPSQLVSYHKGQGKLQHVLAASQSKLEYIAPESAFCEIPETEVSIRAIKNFLEQKITKEMPKNILGIEVNLLQEKRSDHSVYINYTHGLKDHLGNCQRLFHGHRSTFKIYIQKHRMERFERELFNKTFNKPIHFVCWDNIKNQAEVQKVTKQKEPEGIFENLHVVHIAYSASQGLFEAKLPGNLVYFMQKETTAENMSLQFCYLTREMLDRDAQITVHFHEGIGKGAISSI